MNSKATAVVVSLAFHALIALGIVAYIEYAPSPDAVATLDLSSVELSFAEEDDDTAAVMPMPAAPPAKAEPKPPEPSRPPEMEKVELSPSPADPAEFKFPEVVEKVEMVESPAEAQRRREVEKVTDFTESNNQTIKQSNNSPAVAPKQAKVDAPPRPKRNIRPDYPKGARQRGEQGNVAVEIDVNAEGTVDAVRVVGSCGFSELDEAAVKAVKSARFTPAKRGKTSVPSTVRLTVNFKLK